MSSPNDLTGYAALLSLGLIGVGAWIMHRRLRTKSSLALLSAICALGLWIPLSSLSTSLLMFYSDPNAASSWLSYSVMAIEVIVPALLLLLAASCYLLACRAIPLADQPPGPTSPARHNSRR